MLDGQYAAVVLDHSTVITRSSCQNPALSRCSLWALPGSVFHADANSKQTRRRASVVPLRRTLKCARNRTPSVFDPMSSDGRLLRSPLQPSPVLDSLTPYLL